MVIFSGEEVVRGRPPCSYLTDRVGFRLAPPSPGAPMTLKLHWFLPTTVDSRTVVPFGPDGHGRAPTIDYLAQIARAADQLGYEGVLTPTGTWCEDAWLVTAALLRETQRLKFLVAFRPGALSPTLAAQKAATYQRISGGRLLLNIVTGGEPAEQRRF